MRFAVIPRCLAGSAAGSLGQLMLALASLAALSAMTACSSGGGGPSASGGSTGGPTDSGLTDGGAVDAGDAGDAGPDVKRFAASCRQNSDCASGVCDTTGSGNCCNTGCDTSDPLCGAGGCDLYGECRYPAEVACGEACQGGFLGANVCDGLGHCQTSDGGTACPGHLACDLGGTACRTSCGERADCQDGFYCRTEDGTCQPLLAVGFCGDDSQCSSGRCGIGGQGACCASLCNTADSICGATGCDPLSGQCLYPGSEVACGLTSCSGSTLSRGVCQPGGFCGAATAQPCAGLFRCSPDAITCSRSCSSNAQCSGAAFCDPAFAACCPSYLGNTLYIDNTNGLDVACCGSQLNPCKTITRAMSLVVSQGLVGMTLFAAAVGTNGSGLSTGANWDPLSEPAWPIQLGMGVTLVGTQIGIPAGPSPDPSCGAGLLPSVAFLIAPFSPADTAEVTIRGLSAGVVTGPATVDTGALVIGASADTGVNDRSWFYTRNAIQVLGLPLRLDNVFVTAQGAGVSLMGAGARLTLGPGPVTFGGTPAQDYDFQFGNSWHEMSVGISCAAPALADGGLPPANSIVVADDPSGDNIFHSAVVGTALDIGRGCALQLTQHPTIGGVADALCFGQNTGTFLCGYADACGNVRNTALQDDTGLAVRANGVAYLSNADVRCQQNSGVLVSASAGGIGGIPSVFVDNSTINGTTDDPGDKQYAHSFIGLSAETGFATVRDSQIVGSEVGVWQSWMFDPYHPTVTIQGSVDLSDGGNVVGCNASEYSQVPGQLGSTAIGVGTYHNYGADFVNTTVSSSLNAQNVGWDQYDRATGSSQLWSCGLDGGPYAYERSPVFSSCTCAGKLCPAGSAAPGPLPYSVPALFLDDIPSSLPAGVKPIEIANGTVRLGQCPCDGGIIGTGTCP